LLLNESGAGDVRKFGCIHIVKALQVMLSAYNGNEIYWTLVKKIMLMPSLFYTLN
jgi:hypothetical protein